MIFFIFFGCAQPQSTLPVYNEQFTLEEQKIQSQLFAESWLNAYLDLSEVGYRILFGAADLSLEEDQIYYIGIDVATKFSGPENIREEISIILDVDESLSVVAVGQNTPASEAGLLRGDKIITSGGIIGTINKVADNRELQVQVSENVEIKIAPGMVADLYTSTEIEKKQQVKENKSETKGGLLSGLLGKKK